MGGHGVGHQVPVDAVGIVEVSSGHVCIAEPQAGVEPPFVGRPVDATSVHDSSEEDLDGLVGHLGLQG